MPGQAHGPVADRVDHPAMVLVISDYERNRDTGVDQRVDQRVGYESGLTSVGRRHEALAQARRR
jgi:hypothetical protein